MCNDASASIPTPPVAKKVKHEMELFGDVRVDNYYWLRDDHRSDPEVLSYLKEENDYTDRVMSGPCVPLFGILFVLFYSFSNLKRTLIFPFNFLLQKVMKNMHRVFGGVKLVIDYGRGKRIEVFVELSFSLLQGKEEIGDNSY